MTPAMPASGAGPTTNGAPALTTTGTQRISASCGQGEGREGVAPRHTRDETNRLQTVTNLKAEPMELTRR